MPADNNSLPINPAALEAFRTEQTFVDSMQVFLSKFLITDDFKKNQENKHFDFLNNEEQKKLFEYLKPYQELAKQETSIPHSKSSENTCLWMAELAEKRELPVAKVAENHYELIEFIAEMKEKYPKKTDAFSLKDANQSSVDINTYLIMPIQRMPRYRILAENIIDIDKKATVKAYPDLKETLTEISEKNDMNILHLNHEKAKKEVLDGFEKTKLIASTLKQIKPALKNSYLLEEEKVTKKLQSITKTYKCTEHLQKISGIASAINKSIQPIEIFKRTLEGYKSSLIAKITPGLKVDFEDLNPEVNIIKKIQNAKDFTSIKKILDSSAAQIFVENSFLKPCKNDPVLLKHTKEESRVYTAFTDIGHKMEKIQKEITTLQHKINNSKPDSKDNKSDVDSVTEMQKQHQSLNVLRGEIEKNQYNLKECQNALKKAREPQPGGKPGPLESTYKKKLREFTQSISNISFKR
jgi:hypothetical protein